MNQIRQLGDLHPQRIAIVRVLGGLGDFLCSVPTFRALRIAFPKAEIALIGLPSVKPLVERFNYYVDRFLTLPGYPGLPEQPVQLEQIPAFLQMVHSERFDLAIQMHGNGTITNPLTSLLGARINAGFFLPGQYCPDENYFLPYLTQEPEVRRYLRLLKFLGVPLSGEEMEFPLSSDDKQALHVIDEVRDLASGDYVCIHPGASTPSRCWQSERFAAVADALAQLGLRVVITGSNQEAELTQAVARMMKAPSLNLAGRTSLGALAALLNDARLLICNDTGVSHLAAALRVKSVVIFTQSDPNRWAPLNREYHRVVCNTTSVSSEAVIAQAKDVLQNEGSYVT